MVRAPGDGRGWMESGDCIVVVVYRELSDMGKNTGSMVLVYGVRHGMDWRLDWLSRQT